MMRPSNPSIGFVLFKFSLMTLPEPRTGEKTRQHNPMKPIRVLIADDHALVRAGIRALVEKIEGVVVVGEAGKGSEALELIKELNPNLVLLDLTMPDGYRLRRAEPRDKELPRYPRDCVDGP